MTKTTKKKELTLEERTNGASEEIGLILKKYDLGIQAINTRPEVKFVDMIPTKEVEIEKANNKTNETRLN